MNITAPAVYKRHTSKVNKNAQSKYTGATNPIKNAPESAQNMGVPNGVTA